MELLAVVETSVLIDLCQFIDALWEDGLNDRKVRLSLAEDTRAVDPSLYSHVLKNGIGDIDDESGAVAILPELSILHD